MNPDRPGHVIMGMRPLVAVLVLAALLTACSQPRACTEIGTPVGIGLTVEPPLAGLVDRAELEVCWQGECHRPELTLIPATTPVEETCAGDDCSARMTPAAAGHGFATVPGLPKREVRVRLVLRDADGAELLDRALDVTPQGRFPNGPECGEGGPNAELVADAAGVRVAA